MKMLTSFAIALLAVTGCAGQSDSTEESADAIVGVEDLSLVEQAFHLEADRPNAQGHFLRTDNVLRAGACYSKTKGSASGDDWRVRRYTKGAIFFRKPGAAPEGDGRPITCLDLDMPGEGANYTLSLGRFELDTVLRYRLGAPVSSVTANFAFEHGRIPFDFIKPVTDTASSINRPIFYDREFQSVKRPGAAEKGVSAEIVAMVHQFAWRTGKANYYFAVAMDPVGNFLSSDIDLEFGLEHARYEHLDAHRFRDLGSNANEHIYISPKFSDLNFRDRVVAHCWRALGPAGTPIGTFKCDGM
jgi:hypothetical protein